MFLYSVLCIVLLLLRAAVGFQEIDHVAFGVLGDLRDLLARDLAHELRKLHRAVVRPVERLRQIKALQLALAVGHGAQLRGDAHFGAFKLRIRHFAPGDRRKLGEDLIPRRLELVKVDARGHQQKPLVRVHQRARVVAQLQPLPHVVEELGGGAAAKDRVEDKVADSSYGMGDDVTAYTNVYGEVVYIVVKSSDYEGAFLLSTKFKSKEDATYVKLLGENSKVVSIKCAEKVVIDGTRYKDAEQAYLGILDGKEKLTAQFAIIKKNSNGEIKEIDTIKPDNANGNSNSLQVDVPFKYDDEDSETLRQIRANSNTARMGAKIVFDENTKVFIVPNVTSFDNVRDEELWATVGSKLVNDTGAYAQSYRTSESIGVAKYVLLKDYEPSKANAELPILAQKIYTGLDDDGEIVEILKGYQGNASVDIKADDSNSNLFSSKKVSAGDVITLKWDSYGNVIDCTVKYKYSLGKLLESSELNAVMGVFAGYANSVVDNVVKIGYTSGADFDFAVNATSKPVLLFDASETKNPISVATTGDIVTYKNSPTRCSKVVIVTSRMQPQLLVIYK